MDDAQLVEICLRHGDAYGPLGLAIDGLLGRALINQGGMTGAERSALLAICVHAAFADGIGPPLDLLVERSGQGEIASSGLVEAAEAELDATYAMLKITPAANVKLTPPRPPNMAASRRRSFGRPMARRTSRWRRCCSWPSRSRRRSRRG